MSSWKWFLDDVAWSDFNICKGIPGWREQQLFWQAASGDPRISPAMYAVLLAILGALWWHGRRRWADPIKFSSGPKSERALAGAAMVLMGAWALLASAAPPGDRPLPALAWWIWRAGIILMIVKSA